jgi:hypothetical protein
MEILEFSTSRFLMLTGMLGQLDALLGQLKTNAFPEHITAELKKVPWTNIRNVCEGLGLTMSVKSIDRMIQITMSDSPTVSNVKAMFAEFSQRITDELEDNLLLYIPKTHIAWYRGESLFGVEVE